MIMIHHSEKLSNRKKIKRVTYVRARARIWRVFFQNGRQKIVKIQKKIFSFYLPQNIYTKNEVFRYKTTKKKPFETVPSP